MNTKKDSIRTKKGTFKPGNPGGPGRPKKELSIPRILREIGKEEIQLNETGETTERLEYLCRKVWDMALSGNRWAIDYISNRTEGTPVQTVRTQELEEAEIVIQ